MNDTQILHNTYTHIYTTNSIRKNAEKGHVKLVKNPDYKGEIPENVKKAVAAIGQPIEEVAAQSVAVTDAGGAQEGGKSWVGKIRGFLHI